MGGKPSKISSDPNFDPRPERFHILGGRLPKRKLLSRLGALFQNTEDSSDNDSLNTKPLHVLQDHSCLTARGDADGGFNPLRPTLPTKNMIIQSLEQWTNNDQLSSGIFWLNSEAGTGKSELARTVAINFQKSGNLAASFFFLRTSPCRSDGNTLIPTLVYQFIESFPNLRPFVENKIRTNPRLFSQPRKTQMVELLLEPLHNLALHDPGLAAARSFPRLVVIDGLDECRDSDVQCDLLGIFAAIVRQSPYPLRFFITSRPEPCIMRTFDFAHDFYMVNVLRYDLLAAVEQRPSSIKLGDGYTIRDGVK